MTDPTTPVSPGLYGEAAQFIRMLMSFVRCGDSLDPGDEADCDRIVAELRAADRVHRGGELPGQWSYSGFAGDPAKRTMAEAVGIAVPTTAPDVADGKFTVAICDARRVPSGTRVYTAPPATAVPDEVLATLTEVRSALVRLFGSVAVDGTLAGTVAASIYKKLDKIARVGLAAMTTNRYVPDSATNLSGAIEPTSNTRTHSVAGMVAVAMTAVMRAGLPLGRLGFGTRSRPERDTRSKAEQDRLIGAAQHKRERRQQRRLRDAGIDSDLQP